MKFPCPRCRRFYRVKTQGVAWEEGRPLNDGTWTSYKLFMGDLLECEGCGSQMILPARGPFAEHYQPDYEALKTAHAPIVRVDDCGGTWDPDRALQLQQANAEQGLQRISDSLDALRAAADAAGFDITRPGHD